MRKVLSLVLASAMIVTTGCTDAWVKVALADLPILVQMAINISTLVSVVGGQTSPSDVAAINKISAEANTDLTLIDTLYNQYKANPSTGTLQAIQNAIAVLNTNLPNELAAAHISNVALQAKVQAAVGLILTTVTTFSALLPQSGPHTAEDVSPKSLPTPKELKRAWNAQVAVQFK